MPRLAPPINDRREVKLCGKTCKCIPLPAHYHIAATVRIAHRRCDMVCGDANR
jgi:hypothetical protein